MNPLGTRARAEELARLLDGAAAPAASRSGAAALTSYGDLAARLRATGAELAPVTAPREEFRAALRTRLTAVAAVQAHNATIEAPPAASARPLEAALSWPHTRRAQRGLGVAAGAMASVVAVAGIAVAGSQSLPGDPFYSVKRGGEAFQLRTADGEVGKGSKHLDFAAERLREVRGLTVGRDAALGPVGPGAQAASAFGGSVTERVRRTLRDMDTETRRGSELLTAAYRDTRAEAPLEILTAFAGKQSSSLRSLLPDLPAAARAQATGSLALVTEVAAETSLLLAVGVCTGECAPPAAVPSLPPTTGQPTPQPAPSPTSETPCGCSPTPEATPAPSPEPTDDATASPTPTASPTRSPQPSESPSPSPSPSSSPSPSATPGPLPIPLPLPLPLPVPLPVPLPSPLAQPFAVPGGVVPAELAAPRG